ncbi:MAG: NYN domain-containing protein [Corynebacterium sp.]|nr:NYN domain-containing protein [Corynebacterium sp.]
MLDRQFIVVDLENTNCGPVKSIEEANWGYQFIMNWVKPQPQDHVVVATDCTALQHLGMWAKHCRVVIGKGKSGADNQLKKIIAEENITQRFSRVCIVSGDGDFIESVLQLQSQGISVTVYSHEQALNKMLAAVADVVVTSVWSRPVVVPAVVSAAVSAPVPTAVPATPLEFLRTMAAANHKATPIKPATVQVPAHIRKTTPPSCHHPLVTSRSKTSHISLESPVRPSATGAAATQTSPARSATGQIVDRCSSLMKSWHGWAKKVSFLLSRPVD